MPERPLLGRPENSAPPPPLTMLAQDPEALVTHSGWQPSSGLHQPSSVAVCGSETPHIDILRRAASQVWGVSGERGLILGSWAILLLWMDVL